MVLVVFCCSLWFLVILGGSCGFLVVLNVFFCGSWQFIVVLAGYWCVFFGSRAFLVILVES